VVKTSLINNRFIKEGDSVRQFDRVAEVQSDKATVEITSRYDGIVKKLFYKEGDEAHVGETLLDIEVEGEVKTENNKSNKKSNDESPEGQIKKEIKEGNGDDDVRAMPAVRKYAKEHGIDLGQVAKSLGKSNLTIKDLETFGGKESTGQVNRDVVVIKLNPIEKSMSELMSKAASVPHLGLCDDIIVREKNDLLARFIFHLASLVKGTKMNAIYEGGDVIKIHERVNVGVAIDTPHGLIVPIIHDAQTKNVSQIKSELKDLIALAKDNKLPLEKFKNGTITVSNVGTISGTYARPVLVVPQVCIVALGNLIQQKAYMMLPISWAADHRVIDGASIARLSKGIKEKFKDE
jgi:2-oxoisovalerate dehydrogenase E2 component (dihydrolipoyl transacylase)